MTKEIRNHPKLNNFNLNLILTCNTYSLENFSVARYGFLFHLCIFNDRIVINSLTSFTP